MIATPLSIRSPRRSRWREACFFLTLAVAVVAACAHSAPSPIAVVERTTSGDTSIVRNVSGSKWGDSISLVEELRFGEANGAAEYTFGSVELIHEHSSGNILVVDSKSNGKPVATWRLPEANFGGSDPLHIPVTAAGDFFVTAGILPRSLRELNPLYRAAFIRVTSDGVVRDTIFVASSRSEPVVDSHESFMEQFTKPRDYFEPSERFTLHQSGAVLSAWSGKYAFELRWSGDSVLRIEKVQPPVEVGTADSTNVNSQCSCAATGYGSNAWVRMTNRTWCATGLSGEASADSFAAEFVELPAIWLRQERLRQQERLSQPGD